MSLIAAFSFCECQIAQMLLMEGQLLGVFQRGPVRPVGHVIAGTGFDVVSGAIDDEHAEVVLGVVAALTVTIQWLMSLSGTTDQQFAVGFED
ncbi:hypothetical protein ACVBEG_27085 [Pseudomonas sp. GG8]